MDAILEYLTGPYAAAITGAAVATAIYFATRPLEQPPSVDLSNQSEEIPGPDHIHVSCMYPKGSYMEHLFDDVTTLYECMLRGAQVSITGKCMGWREEGAKEYRWITYHEAISMAKDIGSGLIHLGLRTGSFVGIYSQNSVECVLAEHACYSQTMAIVPLYDTLGPHACSFIINETEISTVICDTEEKVITLLAEAALTPTLKTIIVVKNVDDGIRKKAEQVQKIRIISFNNLELFGRKHPQRLLPPHPENIATVCYTSGTTGNPKGVILTHGNIIANVSAVMSHMGDVAPGRNDVMLSFLPLAHMFERCCQVAMYMDGGQVGFFQGNIRQLNEDLKALKPTVIPCVPRLLNRLYTKVQETVNDNQLKKILLRMALESKKSEVNRHIVRTNSIWDYLVLKPIRENLGGRVRLIVVGSAPLAGDILTFLRCALGCVIVEGYGQTECVGPCTMTIPRDPDVDHVGPPLPCCSVKLVDVPDMSYFSSEGKGEVCVKGLSVFQGYLKDKEKTSAVLTADNWLHTGDIGMWLPNGALKILDRKKHIFKLAQGEYVVPEKIENIYICSSFVSQIFVHGESLKSSLVAIVVPERDVILAWCQDKGIKGEWREICDNKDVKTKIVTDLTVLGKKAGLKSFEQVKDIYLSGQPFSVDNNLVTPTLKTRRKNCQEYFKSQIEAMYSLLG